LNIQKIRRLTVSCPLHRKFSGDESFLRDPNAFNDAKNTAAVDVIEEEPPVQAEGKARRGSSGSRL